jgi:hypothetical protein
MEFFKTINDHTRTTYYVLPLIYLNKFSFGTGNFVNAYLAPDATSIVVVVKDSDNVGPAPWASEHFIVHNDKEFHFDIPYVHREAVLKFLDGKYSEMGEMAHGMIRAYSGLNYRKERLNSDGQKVTDTDARLMALEKHPDLRLRLEELLSYAPIHAYVKIDPSSELMSPPTRKEIWKGTALSTVEEG